ncbi:hypothetical protein Tco_0111217 [Tanacetum coccineum]
MTSANDGYNGGAGGKLRKKVLRKTTPYDQPITNPNPKNTSKSSFFSRLIYAVTCAFWRRNPAVTEAPVTGTNEEQRNLRYISSATEISDIETMLKKKTFTSVEKWPFEQACGGEGELACCYNNSKSLPEDIASPVRLVKARSRGRTTMYRMARSPYYRGPSTLTKKPAWELEGSNGSKMAGKRRSSVQDDRTKMLCSVVSSIRFNKA